MAVRRLSEGLQVEPPGLGGVGAMFLDPWVFPAPSLTEFLTESPHRFAVLIS